MKPRAGMVAAAHGLALPPEIARGVLRYAQSSSFHKYLGIIPVDVGRETPPIKKEYVGECRSQSSA